MNRKAQIRVATLNDAPAILNIYKPYILETAVTFEEEVPSLQDFEDRMANILLYCPFLVCELNGEIAGYAYASAHRSRSAYRRNKEVSVYVDSRFQRKNIARALYTSLFAILKKQGLTNLLAGITIPNVASVALHETFKFEKCAEYHYIGFKQGKWHSVGWWELCLLDQRADEPTEPMLFSLFEKQVNLTPFFDEGVALIKI